MNAREQRTILLVEDEALINTAEKQTLKKHGFNVISASSGEKAIEITRAVSDIDLILMDINLGKGEMDGAEAAQIILGEKEVPVIFLSNYIHPEALQKIKKIASYGYIVKDSGETILITSIEMAFKLYEANQKLKESEEKYRAIFENAVEGIFQTTPEGKFISANPALAKMFGYDSPEELMGSVSDIGGQLYGDHEKRSEHLIILNQKGMVNKFEARMHRKDGSIFWISINTGTVRDHIGKPLYYEGFAVDITKHKEAEEERDRLVLELKDALSQVKTLSGLLPICASCKKIENNKGCWEEMEVYIRDHSEADFSHGICPECAEKLYPEYYKKK